MYVSCLSLNHHFINSVFLSLIFSSLCLLSYLQKDDGVPGKRQNFNTFLKAEIFCIKRTIGTPESVGSQTHYYTGLRKYYNI